MTDISHTPAEFRASNRFEPTPPLFDVEEFYWGYTIKSATGPQDSIAFAQGLSTFFGACFAAAASGLLFAPSIVAGQADFMLRAVAAFFFGSLAVYLLWFASRGTQSEVQVDTKLGEVREVVKNRAGRATVLGIYGFDAIGGVHIDRSNGNSSVLVLRFGNTAQIFPVATGPAAALETLRDRLGQDLIIERVEETHAAALLPSRARAA